jgi:hypothetical protein
MDSSTVSRPDIAAKAERAEGKPAFCAEDGFLRIDLPEGFEMTLDSMSDLWREGLDLARRTGLDRVLLEGGRVTRAMRPIDAYRHGVLLSSLESPGLRVACCLREFEPDVVTWLFTRTANAGTSRVELFRNHDDALRWLSLR